MTVKISTGLANSLLAIDSFYGLFSGNCKLHIYSGTAPSSANDSLGSATLLCTISKGDTGDGLSFNASADGNVLQKSNSESWKGTCVASGTASFCRLALDSDSTSYSETDIRIQGDVGIIGAFLNLSSLSLMSGAVQVIDNMAVAIPLQ